MTKPGEKDADQAQRAPRHAAPDNAERSPLIDLTRDPTPGVPDHAAPGEDDE
ncbi:MAG TPA: hypothetical protein VHW44_24495 [Pseudonocardiaceae bacterium]|jgi:hypothetical protein|nr:hypothetical protein [Pseudonocardiaceae bacterium]